MDSLTLDGRAGSTELVAEHEEEEEEEEELPEEQDELLVVELEVRLRFKRLRCLAMA